MVVVIGAAHTVLGTTTWMSTGPEQRVENFWFTAFGVLAIAFGVAIGEVERAHGFVPMSVLIAIAVVALFGIVLFAPLSGFLSLIVPIAFGVYRWLRRGRRAVQV